MSAARDQILAAVRKAKEPAPKTNAGPGRQALLPPKFVREARDLSELFLEKLTAAAATYAVLDRASEIPQHLVAWLKTEKLSDVPIVLAEEPQLRALDWAGAGIAARHDKPDILAPSTIVSAAFAGVAETGSIALLTNADSRPSHNLLADTHVVVLSRSQIAASFEDVWRAVRVQGLPRSLAFITGASRTADIEMTIELGVHGAVRMHVILLNEQITARGFSR